MPANCSCSLAMAVTPFGRKLAPTLFKVLSQQTYGAFRREIFNRQQVFFHPDGIAHHETAGALRFGDGAGLRNPIRTADHMAFVQEEVAVICEGESRKTKAATGAQAIRPFHQHPLQVMLDEGMLQHVPGSVGDQCCLRHRVFVRSVVGIGFFAGLQHSLTLLGAEQLE